MQLQVVLGIAVVAFFVLLRHFAARRVMARQGRFVWLMFVPTLLGSVVILWGSIQIFASVPLVGALMATGGVINLASLVRLLTRMSGSVNSAGPRDDIATAITEPLVDYISTLTGLVLIGGLVAIVGLIIWGVSARA
jgi:hypothetical protein